METEGWKDECLFSGSVYSCLMGLLLTGKLNLIEFKFLKKGNLF